MDTRRAPLGARRRMWTVAYSHSTVSTASKRNEVDMACPASQPTPVRKAG
jgi:hypothetical protein